MDNEKQERCINIDWLEVYCLESNDRYPCDAEYFRKAGYKVREREYGTRVYNQMFEILNEDGSPILEVRREPASGSSDFVGLCPQSCHLRVPNWFLYQGNPVDFLREFMVQHDYIFKRIFRLDICLDFEYFDSGDKPSAFVRRYIEGKFRKVNQCRIASYGQDDWNDFKWESLSWGSPSSMVSTKLYNKTLELSVGKTDKPYIRTAWMMAGLVDNPCSLTKKDDKGELKKVDVWRLEFSMKSKCNGWIVIEAQKRKGVERQHIPHLLNMFDSKDKLWSRMQDLIYHYFRFKYREFQTPNRGCVVFSLEAVHSDMEKNLKRKDRCHDKRLFYFDKGHQFLQLNNVPRDAKAIRDDMILQRRLQLYRARHADAKIREACDILLKEIDLTNLVNYSPKHHYKEARALQIALANKMSGDVRSVGEILDEVLRLINEDMIF